MVGILDHLKACEACRTNSTCFLLGQHLGALHDGFEHVQSPKLSLGVLILEMDTWMFNDESFGNSVKVAVVTD